MLNLALTDEERRLLARALMEYRLETGYSPSAFAQIIGRDPSLISRLENGRAVPRLEHLFALRTEVGLSVDWLMDEVRPQPEMMEREERSAHGISWRACTPRNMTPRVFECYLFPGMTPTMKPRIHDGEELIEVLEGHVDVTLGAHSRPIFQHQVLRIPPYVRHAVVATRAEARVRWTMSAEGEQVHTYPDPDLSGLRRLIERRARKSLRGTEDADI
jgi:transcriptional regulator with XRE-family HTH domain